MLPPDTTPPQFLGATPSESRARSDVTSATRELEAVLDAQPRPEADGWSLVPPGGGSGSEAEGGSRLLERASTLILTRAPTLSRARSLLLRDEVQQIADQQQTQEDGVPPAPSPVNGVRSGPGERPVEGPGEDLGGLQGVLPPPGASSWYHATTDVTDHGPPDTSHPSDTDYDTDLEDAVSPKKKAARTKSARRRDHGRATYRDSCRKLGVLPVTSVDLLLPGHEMILRYRSLRSRETLALCNALLDNRTIVELNLDGNNLGPKGADYIALLLSDSKRLKICNLADNALGSVGGEAVCEALLTNQSLTAIGLSGNGFTDRDANYFSRVFQRNKFLRDVNLSHNGFGDRAAEVLGPAIAANDYIKTLDLSWNKFRPSGGVLLAKGLENNVALRSLNLAMNGFSTRGATAIGQALTKNVTLTDLDLTFNRIYDDAAISLAKGLVANESLKYLYLANNPLTTNAALGLLAAIDNNETTAMLVLDMMNIFLSNEIIHCLDRLRESRPQFRFQFAGMVGSSTHYGNATAQGIRDYDPLLILMEFASRKGLRVLEMFKQFDRDGSGSISRGEFVEGIKMFEIPLTEAQLDDLISQLDKDGDGEIDYGELLLGEKDYRKKMLKLKKRMATKGAAKR